MTEIRYRFYPEPTSKLSRQAESLCKYLNNHLQLRLEMVKKPPYLPDEWKSLYPLLNKTLNNPKVVIHHCPLSMIKIEPLLWNIGYISWEDEKSSSDHEIFKELDEIWVTSQAEKEDIIAKLSMDSEKVKVFLPVIDNSIELPEKSELELEPGFKFFHACNRSDMSRLKRLFPHFLNAFKSQGAITLILKVEALGEQELAEDEINLELEAIAKENNLIDVPFEILTVVGKATRQEFMDLINQCDVTVCTQGYLMALESLNLGKPVISTHHPVLNYLVTDFLELDQIEKGADLLKSVYQKSVKPEINLDSFHVDKIGLEISRHLKCLDETVDLSARKAALQVLQDKERQGRKQKFSLFHKDFDQAEMQARRQWHAKYAVYFKDCLDPVMDIGCGSGIFLEILRDMFIPGLGIDYDQDMVDVCNELGLSAILADDQTIGNYDNYFGGIHASHIIEHVDGDRAIALVENCLKALKPGGRLVIRTPNFRNDNVRVEGFWLDITHIRPYPLALLREVLNDTGFEVIDEGFEPGGWNDTYIVGKKPY